MKAAVSLIVVLALVVLAYLGTGLGQAGFIFGIVLPYLALAVFLVGWMCAASIQFSQQGLVGADSHFHVRYSEIMAQQGPLERFPWTQTSVQRDRFMDKDFLLHVILIPFLGDDLCFGPKVLTSLLTGLLFLLLACKKKVGAEAGAAKDRSLPTGAGPVS